MMTSIITFLRRGGLGSGSVRGMSAYLDSTSNPRGISVKNYQGSVAGIQRNDYFTGIPDHGWLVRWGCTSVTNVPLSRQINTSDAIKTVNDKRGFRLWLHEHNLCPHTVDNLSDFEFWHQAGISWVVRPATHAQGRNLFVINSEQELLNVLHKPCMARGWYASYLINKSAEYRVYVVSGKVATVAQKTPGDPTQVAWNVHQGGRFDVLPRGQWPMEVCRVAIESFKGSGLDFGGVDVMVGQENDAAYCVEINSAPSLPLLSDGSVSYRQKCMAKCFKYITENGKDTLEVDGYNGWRDVIHPAVL